MRPWDGAATAPDPEEEREAAMQRTVVLSPEDRGQLEWITKSDPKPYRRERAAALLKIAAGEVAAQVARTGLLRRRKPETVYRCLPLARPLRAGGLGWLDLTAGTRAQAGAFPPCTRNGRPRTRGCAISFIAARTSSGGC